VEYLIVNLVNIFSYFIIMLTIKKFL